MGLFAGTKLAGLSGWGLDFAMTVTFIGIAVPLVRSLPSNLGLPSAVPVAVLMPQGILQVKDGQSFLFGSLAAILVAWLTKRLLPTIAAGMAVFLFWKLVVVAPG